MAALTDRMREWATGRSPWWRLPLFGFLAIQVLRHLRSMEDRTLFSGIVFGAHEFGHLFFAFFGEWMGIAGGSLMQLLIPIGAAAVVYRSRDWFGIAACGVFLAASLADVSWYIADARTQDLDLVSFSPDGAVHDWNYLLGSMGLLRHEMLVARLARFTGFLVLLASTILALRLCWWMYVLRKEAEPVPT
jgi:hypothetical protein